MRHVLNRRFNRRAIDPGWGLSRYSTMTGSHQRSVKNYDEFVKMRAIGSRCSPETPAVSRRGRPSWRPAERVPDPRQDGLLAPPPGGVPVLTRPRGGRTEGSPRGSKPKNVPVGRLCKGTQGAPARQSDALFSRPASRSAVSKTYGPPRRQAVCVGWLEQSTKTYPAFRLVPLAKMEIRASWSS